MYCIVASLYKFMSCLQTGVKIKCPTDHKNLESWVKRNSGGPVGARSCWHRFLARFPLDVVYIKGEDNGAGHVLSRWAYPINLHGSDADQAVWDESEG